MHFTSRAIVLQNIKYSETSVICKLFTEQFGVMSYMINGVRTTKGRSKASLLQPLTILEIEATQRDNKNLQRLKEVKRLKTFVSIPFDIRKSAMAQLIVEVLNKALHPHEANQDLFEFVFDSLCFLDDSTHLNPDFHLFFLIQLSSFIGFQPHGSYTSVTPLFDLKEGAFVSTALSDAGAVGSPHSKYISDLCAANFTQVQPILSNSAERNTLLNYLVLYYKHHIEGFGNLKSPEVLRMIFD
jgi:DNA repair protein RecO (recombination protein O)